MFEPNVELLKNYHRKLEALIHLNNGHIMCIENQDDLEELERLVLECY